MTIGGWLRGRAPAPPQLSARIVGVVHDRLDEPADRLTEVLLAAAEGLLGELAERPTAGRESALDLLTVDALVTYAFEAACANPELLPARTRDAMRRLAPLAAA